MTNKTINNPTRLWILTSLFGCLLFVILYIIATLLYPGGSQADLHSKGFSWINNYWCNLLNEQSINGEANTARPVAILAMLVLCISLGIFWYQFPKVLSFRKYGKRTIQFSGVLSMIIVLFISSHYHDAIINISGGVGLIALTGTYIGLYKSGWYALFWYGIFNLLLIAINNYIYYTSGLLVYLPVFQKLTFLSFITWICLIDLSLYKRQGRV